MVSLPCRAAKKRNYLPTLLIKVFATTLQERWEEPDAEYASPKLTQHSGDGSKAGQQQKARRFMPFSVGARDCAGQSLARMNYTTTVAMLLSHFSFKLAAEVCLSFQQHVFIALVTSERGMSLVASCQGWVRSSRAPRYHGSEVKKP